VTYKNLPEEIKNDALFRQWLRAQGLKLTPHRRSVLTVLRNSHSPLSIKALHKKVPHAHFVTLYRTLAMFERAGVVRKIGLSDERARFELAFDHHHHIVCTSCEKVEDVEVPDKKLEQQALAKSRQFRAIERHALEFFGICKHCAAS
jgi:Fe2+ or Zn2+ uptake regulation protein